MYTTTPVTTRGTANLHMVLAGFVSQQGIQPGPLCDKCVIKAVFNILIDLIFDCTPLLYLWHPSG